VILVLSLQYCPFQPKLDDGENEDINKIILELRKRLHDQVAPTSVPNNMGLLLNRFFEKFWVPLFGLSGSSFIIVFFFKIMHSHVLY
jgi:hypothetical protein